MNEHKPAPVGPHRFWVHCIDKYGGPVLELACGNGRWLVPLAEHGSGHEVVGVDVNKGLIESAREYARQRKEAGHAVNATFCVGDIVNLDLARTFPLAIMTSWTFQVLLSQENQISFLRRLHDHLAPGGAFAFNLFIPFYRRRNLVRVNGAYQWPPHPKYGRAGPNTYDPATQIETRIDYGVHPINLRHTTLAEIELLFRVTGFKIAEMYGDDEDMRPFTGARDNDYTILAERTA